MPIRSRKGLIGAAIVAGMFVWGGKRKSKTSDSGDGYGDNYSLEDLTVTNSSYDNNPDTNEQLENIQYTSRILDEVAELIGYAPHVNSGYRSTAVNDDVGGVSSSAHLSGLAVDLHFGKSSDEDSAEKLRVMELLYNSDLPIDQAIAYGINSDGTNNPDGKSHIHIGFSKDGSGRKQYLYTVSGASKTFYTWNPSTFSNT